MHLLAVSALALASLVVPQGDPPPTGKITIDVVTINGNGCGRGASVSVAPDNTGFSLDYGEVVAWVGGASRPTDARKQCQFRLRVNSPRDHTFQLAPTVYRGWVHAEPGATASARFTHAVQGLLPHSVTYGFTGPVDDYWERTDSEGLGVPCGQTPLITFSAELRASLGTSDPKKDTYLATDSFMTEHRFTWTRCP